MTESVVVARATGCRLLIYIRAAGTVGTLHHRVRHGSHHQAPAHRGQDLKVIANWRSVHCEAPVIYLGARNKNRKVFSIPAHLFSSCALYKFACYVTNVNPLQHNFVFLVPFFVLWGKNIVNTKKGLGSTHPAFCSTFL
jgi:hypothetical protein